MFYTTNAAPLFNSRSHSAAHLYDIMFYFIYFLSNDSAVALLYAAPDPFYSVTGSNSS